MSDINATLDERGKRYGSFVNHAELAQEFKTTAMTPGYFRMKPDARQAMDVIFDKFARMLNGDPEYDDNWRDVVGYATLVLNRMESDQAKTSDTKEEPVGELVESPHVPPARNEPAV